MILYRQHHSTTFTSVKPARVGSVAYSLPHISPAPVTKMKLAPETWRELGCPDQLHVSRYEQPDEEPAEFVVEGGWASGDQISQTFTASTE